MTEFLTESTLCATRLPAAWAPVLEDLQAFLELEAVVRAQREADHGAAPNGAPPAPPPAASPGAADPETRLARLHDRLVERSAALLEPAALDDLPEAESARLFARALLFLARLKDCVIGDADVLDTAGSRTLALYEADFYRTPAAVADLRAALRDRLGLSPEEIAGLDAAVEGDLQDARRKAAVVRALRAEFALDPANPGLRDAAFALFRAFYPDAPLVAGEVELIVSATALFFCLPFAGEELDTPRCRALPAAERAALRAFLKRLTTFTQDQFARFPAFGFMTGDRLDPALLARLAARAGLTPAALAHEIGAIVTILPLAEIDKYVIHDVWGHGWQASMLGFEHMYAEMARFGDPLTLAETARSRAGAGLALGACFRGRGAELALDPAAFRRFVDGEIAERLPVALSAVLAEMLADVVEFKFLEQHPAHADDMPSSSFFKNFPTKLDLTLRDVPFYFGQATKAFRLWAKDPARRARTAGELVALGGTPDSAAAAVAAAVAEWEALARRVYAPRLAWEAGAGGDLAVNAFTRVALNFLGIHRALLDACRRTAAAPVAGARLPLKSCKDLIVFGAAVFFEADRPRNLWRVDEYLALRFLPLCRRLGLGG